TEEAALPVEPQAARAEVAADEPLPAWMGEAPAEPFEPARQAPSVPERIAEVDTLPEPSGLGSRLLAAPNRWFDQATRPFGKAGAWLRGEQGRTLLGFSGLALLAAAGAVAVLDWILGNW